MPARLPIAPATDLLADAALLPGPTFRPDLLGAAKEVALIGLGRALPLALAPYKADMARRRILIYWGRYDFETQTLRWRRRPPPPRALVLALRIAPRSRHVMRAEDR